MIEWQMNEEALLLRPLEMKDLETHYQCVFSNREHLRAYFPWPEEDYSLETAKAYIQSSMRLQKEGKGAFLGIFYENACVGSVCLREIDVRNRRASIAYWISKDAEGRGFVKRCLKELLCIAFGRLNIHRLQIYVAVDNTRSRYLAESLGFALEGILKDREFLNGRFVDHALYALMREEKNFG